MICVVFLCGHLDGILVRSMFDAVRSAICASAYKQCQNGVKFVTVGVLVNMFYSGICCEV